MEIKLNKVLKVMEFYATPNLDNNCEAEAYALAERVKETRSRSNQESCIYLDLLNCPLGEKYNGDWVVVKKEINDARDIITVTVEKEIYVKDTLIKATDEVRHLNNQRASTPRLENWKVVCGNVVGSIYNYGKFEDGTLVMTSSIAKFEKDAGFVVTTDGTKYILGSEAKC